jgi:hypothetical protein
MDIQWVKIRAWHAVRPDRSIPDWNLTYCGRAVGNLDPHLDRLPGEKSCESCLRIIARKVDA